MSYRIKYSRDSKWVSVHPEPKWPEWFDYTDPYNAKWIKSKYPQGLPCNTDYMKKEVKNANIMSTEEIKRQIAMHEYIIASGKVQSVWDPNKEVDAHPLDINMSEQMLHSLHSLLLNKPTDAPG